MTKKRHEYLDDNKHWRAFKKILNDRGVAVSTIWQAKSSSTLKHPNVHCLTFGGEGVRKDAPMAILVDYCVGKPLDDSYGYALYMERGNSIPDDVAAICK